MSERRPPARFGWSDGAGLEPLDGHPVLVNLVLNLEHWTLDAPMPRAILPAPHGVSVVPDVANASWVLYGLRAGLPRIARALEPLGAAVTVALNADVIEHYPPVADLVADRGWEVVAHGVRQRSIQSYEHEEPVIVEALERIAARFGPARGWLSPGMNQTDHSLSLMRRHGLEFNHDWMIDDRPVWLDTAAGPVLGLPYTLTLNDVTVYQIEHHGDGTLADRTARTLVRHILEGEPVVMPIGLHPHLIGVPHRIGELERIVDLIVQTPEALAVTSSQVHDWYVAQVAAP